MIIKTVLPSGWRLEDDAPLRREPTRPAALQDDDFRSKFDYTTIFYDVFYSIDKRHVICIGPAFSNLRKHMRKTQFFVSSKYNTDKRISCSRKILHQNKCAQIWISLSNPAATTLDIESPLGNVAIPIGDNMANLFAGKNVLLTKQKDNNLSWIVDWINLNTKLNDINAVLLFDNQSTRYDLDTLCRRLAEQLVNIDVVVVAQWPYPFGPLGGQIKAALSRESHEFTHIYAPWDSNFTDLCIPNIGLWRYLIKANFVLWGDVDELVITENINGKGDSSLLAELDKTDNGILVFGGGYICNVCDNYKLSELNPEDSDYFRYSFQTQVQYSGEKWCCKPKYMKLGDQWQVHEIYIRKNIIIRKFLKILSKLKNYFGYAHSNLKIHHAIKMRHFRNISTDWAISSRSIEKIAFDPHKHFFDCSLVKRLNKVAAELPGYSYPLHTILDFAYTLSACPRKEKNQYIPDLPDYNCNICEYNATRMSG